MNFVILILAFQSRLCCFTIPFRFKIIYSSLQIRFTLFYIIEKLNQLNNDEICCSILSKRTLPVCTIVQIVIKM